jgi:hypothetical protein
MLFMSFELSNFELRRCKQKADKNKDDAKTLLESIVKLIFVIREDVLRHGDLCGTRCAELCKDFGMSVHCPSPP